MGNMVTAVTGIRDLSTASYADVELVVLEEATLAAGMRFGGAAGTDTVALAALCEAPIYKQVIVPHRLRDQPREAAQIARRCADETIELKLPKSRTAPLRRNDELLSEAARLLAFSDGRESGGTFYTIREARALGLDVVVVPVLSEEETSGIEARAAPALEGVEHFPWGAVYWFDDYYSARHGDPLSDLVVRRMKLGMAGDAEIWSLAQDLANFARREIPPFDAILAMPRRVPGIESDLEPLAAAMAVQLGVKHYPGWLMRVAEPKGGFVRAYRVRFPADEHYRTIAVAGPIPARRILILDNVLTLGGTMEGAIRRVRDATGAEVMGLAILRGMR